MRAPAFAVAAVAVGVAVLVAALRFGGGIIETEIAGLPSAGPITDWGLPLVRFCLDLCAVACLGTLLAAVVLAPPRSPEAAACTRAAGWWALGLAASAALSYLLTVSSIIPMPLVDLLAFPDMLSFGAAIPQTQALLSVLALATALVLLTLLPGVPGWMRLATAAFALLPPAYVGHAASGGDHDIAVSALISHLLAVSAWVGGLLAVLVHFRRSDHLAVVLPRFSTIALCCFAAVAFSGLAGAWVRLNTPAELWQTSYGLLLLAKTAVLGVLAWFGRNHRRRTVSGVAERSVRHTFIRLAAGEVIVMVAAMGLAVGLSHTPPPVGGGHGETALGYELAPFSLVALIAEFRLDPTILLLLALPAIGYLAGVRRLAHWPAGRTLAWYAGLALTALVLLGGVGGYARAMPSVQALQHVVLSVVAPILLCLGAPFTLARKATTAASQYGDLGSWSPAWRVLAHPTFLLAACTLPGLLLYGAPWLSWSLSSWAAHLVTELVFLGLGLLVFSVVTGADPLPRPFAPAARAWLLAVVTVVQLGLGAVLLLGPPVAAGWFSLAAPAAGVADVLADQRLAGAVFMILPLPPLGLLAVRLARLRQPAPARLRTDPAT
ncbi:cytochrome c oxidase assembly protein [Nonomuraea sp. H19]|uniref:cytochrome c oxidase assembly protein n=1 Tax=Nonomuraea sp. H19 TaxID=3452206 RepID=UPI003F89623D